MKCNIQGRDSPLRPRRLGNVSFVLILFWEAAKLGRMKRFSAPWGRSLVWISVVSAAILVTTIVVIAMTHRPAPLFVLPVISWVLLVTLLAILFITALFTVRGYTVMADAILVHRLLWDTRLPREGLVSATLEPGVMNWGVRLCGNGGLFSFTGWFWSKKLGRYRAYVTDLTRTVVLRYEKRTVVVSPGDPGEFVRELMG